MKGSLQSRIFACFGVCGLLSWQSIGAAALGTDSNLKLPHRIPDSARADLPFALVTAALA